jgi:hypothetical protein
MYILVSGLLVYSLSGPLLDILRNGGSLGDPFILAVGMALIFVGTLISFIGFILEKEKLRKFSLGFAAIRLLLLVYFVLNSRGITPNAPLVYGFLAVLNPVPMASTRTIRTMWSFFIHMKLSKEFIIV